MKGIIVIGSAGSGKTTFLEQLYIKHNELEYFKWINQDFIVEDKDHKFYNNPLQAAKFIKNEVIPEILKYKRNFIWDCTGANIKPIKKLIENNPNYQFKIVVVYCNPIIAFLRNFSRERKVPKQVVLENWLKVYSQLEEYIELVGKDNIYIYETEYTPEEQIYLNNYSSIKEVLDNNPGAYNSTFRVYDKEYSKEEIELKINKLNNIINKVDTLLLKFTEENNFLTPVGVEINYIKEELNKWITK